jgi:aryl-phospho-beta-D-glucosidase BglC (GH1 family)
MKGLRVAALGALLRSAWAQAGNCPGTFTSISAADFVSRVHPGWNLGNTLDAVPNEGSWNNAPVQASTFDTVKSSGFKSVRLPGELDSVPLSSTSDEPAADNFQLHGQTTSLEARRTGPLIQHGCRESLTFWI